MSKIVQGLEDIPGFDTLEALVESANAGIWKYTEDAQQRRLAIKEKLTFIWMGMVYACEQIRRDEKDYWILQGCVFLNEELVWPPSKFQDHELRPYDYDWLKFGRPWK